MILDGFLVVFFTFYSFLLEFSCLDSSFNYDFGFYSFVSLSCDLITGILAILSTFLMISSTFFSS